MDAAAAIVRKKARVERMPFILCRFFHLDREMVANAEFAGHQIA